LDTDTAALTTDARNVGATPSRALLHRDRTLSFSLENVEGMVPVSWLLDRTRDVNMGRLPKAAGIGPCRPALDRDKDTTRPEAASQLTPSQPQGDTTAVPVVEGAVVGQLFVIHLAPPADRYREYSARASVVTVPSTAAALAAHSVAAVGLEAVRVAVHGVPVADVAPSRHTEPAGAVHVAVHALTPTRSLKVPREQGKHTLDAAGANRPWGHCTATVDPAGHAEPAGHGVSMADRLVSLHM